MLAYLDALLAALTMLDAAEVTRLLAHPLARILTREALAEAEAAIAPTAGNAAGAPLRILQLRHQTAHLLGASADASSRTGSPRRSLPPSTKRRKQSRQMELPLSA